MICKRKPEYSGHTHKELIDLAPETYLEHSSVFASDLVWEPLAGQVDMLEGQAAKPLFENILITKLRENQEIELTLYCSKNTGNVHAKWSPVSTAYYRLLPSITLKRPVEGADAHELASVCPAGVFAVKKHKKTEQLDIEDVYKCTMCRECIRSDKFNDVVELGKERKKYVFTIESVGVLRPERLFLEAIQVVKAKAQHYLAHLKGLRKNSN